MKNLLSMLLCIATISLMFLVSCQKQTSTSVPISQDSSYIKQQQSTKKLLDSLKIVINYRDSTTSKTVSLLNSEIGDLQNSLSVLQMTNSQTLVNKVVIDSATAINFPIKTYPNFISFTYDSLGYLKTSVLLNGSIYNFTYTHYFTDTTVVQIGISTENSGTNNHFYHVVISKITKNKTLKAYNLKTYALKSKEIRL